LARAARGIGEVQGDTAKPTLRRRNHKESPAT
jgi:hypothetical protein